MAEAKKVPTKPYRYVGPGKHHVDDATTETGSRPAKPGEVVELTERQAEQFRDRFQPVEEAKAPAAPPPPPGAAK